MFPLRDSIPSHSTPVVTGTLIGINVLVFLYQVFLTPEELHHFVMTYGVVPARFSWLDVLTSMFLHGGWMHLIGNMWFLWVFGDNIEDILGRGKYLLFYLGSGAAAALAQIAVSPESRIPLVGASGAIAGIMGAYLLKFPHSRILTLIFIVIFIQTVDLPAYVLLIYWFVLQFFSGVGTVADAAQKGGVAWFAHIGGFLAGMALISILKTRDPHWRRRELRW
ncbi:MAG: rhomboid family intramembrane serine protease [Bryobacteraceae bacterium]|nr:rhomboid family intramembrane serine protease [Bryobacteraceae bacterium]